MARAGVAAGWSVGARGAGVAAQGCGVSGSVLRWPLRAPVRKGGPPRGHVHGPAPNWLADAIPPDLAPRNELEFPSACQRLRDYLRVFFNFIKNPQGYPQCLTRRKPRSFRRISGFHAVQKGVQL